MLYDSNIENNLHSAIKGGAITDNTFNTLSMNVFKYQYSHNPAYQKFCHSLKITPDCISNWKKIPTVPTDVFKLPLPISTFPLKERKITFQTSGTTSETKGQHHFPSLDLYRTSILAGWKYHNLPQPKHAIFLTPRPDDAPYSSLSSMMGTLASLTESSLWSISPSGEINLPAISQSIQKKHPVALLGTALAFLHLFKNLKTPLPLPQGSWAMETGGYKGTQNSLTKESLYALFAQHLGLPAESIINEYSMTELSSQFYTRGLGKPHTCPPWTRIRVINHLTQTDSQAGEPGYLVIYDLANLHSIMAIQTQDIAIAHGNNSFTLIGRDPSAIPRGCSRAADDTFNKSHD